MARAYRKALIYATSITSEKPVFKLSEVPRYKSACLNLAADAIPFFSG
ncbi:hypothetical protein V9L20_01140 [Variovorax sp. CCNWLW225]